ncbi:MAG: hypothetical protein J5986_11050 [Roseburia sp.]|nr:hypothetical protein [Roseburia sp.]
MLKYLEETTSANVTNQNIAAVENLVNKVKHRREVSISYMKSWEWEQMVRDEGKEDGKNEARQEGIKIFIETCQEFGVSKEDTASKLAEKYHLSTDDIQNYLENYWT